MRARCPQDGLRKWPPRHLTLQRVAGSRGPRRTSLLSEAVSAQESLLPGNREPHLCKGNPR